MGSKPKTLNVISDLISLIKICGHRVGIFEFLVENNIIFIIESIKHKVWNLFIAFMPVASCMFFGAETF